MSIKRYSVIAIMLRYILRYRITLYHSIAKLSFLNVIALDTQEPSWRLNPNLDGYKKERSWAAQGHIWPAHRPTAGWLFRLRCLFACHTHRSSQRPDSWYSTSNRLKLVRKVNQLFSPRHYTDPHSGRKKSIHFACQLEALGSGISQIQVL